MIKYSFLVVAVMLMLGASMAEAGKFMAKVHAVRGDATHQAPGETNWQPLQRGQNLPIGTTVKTGRNGFLILATVPGTAVRVARNTTMTISDLEYKPSATDGPQRKALLDLKDGTVSAMISKDQPETTDFKINTPQGTAAARGTFYGVTVKEGQMYLGVESGAVAAENSEGTATAAPTES